MDPDWAKAIIELVAIDRVSLTDAEQAIDKEERREIEDMRKRREVRTFPSMNIPIGSVLTFIKDETITCTVSGPRKVNFRGEELSPSAAALHVVHEMGYDWPAISGMAYWAYEGIKIGDYGNRSVPVDDVD